MVEFKRKESFIWYKNIKLIKNPIKFNRYSLDINSDFADYKEHYDWYIPMRIDKAEFILYALYDYELTKEHNIIPSKVIYTDFYYKAKTKGILS